MPSRSGGHRLKRMLDRDGETNERERDLMTKRDDREREVHKKMRTTVKNGSRYEGKRELR